MSTKLIDFKLPKNCNVVLGIDQSLTGFALTALSIDNPKLFAQKFTESVIYNRKRKTGIMSMLTKLAL